MQRRQEIQGHNQHLDWHEKSWTDAPQHKIKKVLICNVFLCVYTAMKNDSGKTKKF